jgi:hypothetical protein
VWYDN